MLPQLGARLAFRSAAHGFGRTFNLPFVVVGLDLSLPPHHVAPLRTFIGRYASKYALMLFAICCGDAA